MSTGSTPTDGASPRADLLSALLWIAFGSAVFIASWRMDRLEHLNINSYEIPGLVPGMLGGMLVVLGLLLALRAVRQGGLHRSAPPAGGAEPGAGRGYMALVLGAMLLYSLVLVGHGLPFWLSTFVFVSGFIFVFDRGRQSALGRPAWKQAALALVVGAATSAVVSLAFEHIFYVRLP